MPQAFLIHHTYSSPAMTQDQEKVMNGFSCFKLDLAAFPGVPLVMALMDIHYGQVLPTFPMNLLSPIFRCGLSVMKRLQILVVPDFTVVAMA
jgi:hypothetical protein